MPQGCFCCWLPFAAFPIWIITFQKFRLEEKESHTTTDGRTGNGLSGKKPRKILQEHGVDENTIEKMCIDDRADFNSNRRFYHWTSDFGEYLEGMADREQNTEVKTVTDLLDEIEDETLYRALLMVDRCTLQSIPLKMQGYSTKEIAPLIGLTTGAIYARPGHLRTANRHLLFLCRKCQTKMQVHGCILELLLYHLRRLKKVIYLGK